MKEDEITSSKESSSLSSAAVPSNYGSTSGQDKSPVQLYIPCCGLILYIMTFLGLFCAFCLRVSISEAIVAMVNTSEVERYIVTINASENIQCPPDPQLQLLRREFVWSRLQQGLVLAAFYIGHEFTQVCNLTPRTQHRACFS